MLLIFLAALMLVMMHLHAERQAMKRTFFATFMPGDRHGAQNAGSPFLQNKKFARRERFWDKRPETAHVGPEPKDVPA